MIENELLIKISKSLKEICEKEKIGVIDSFTLIINSQIDFSTENLLKRLIIDMPENVTKKSEIFVKKMNLEILSAVIYKVEGEKEKKCFEK